MSTTSATLCLRSGGEPYSEAAPAVYAATGRSSAYERSYPAVFASKKEFLFHPMKPDRVRADVLEIGPGRGDFLFALAAACPDRRITAVESGGKRYHKLVRRIETRGLTNVLLIKGDARLVIPACIPRRSLGAVYVLFPDPWPKRRHAFHRLLTAEFLGDLASCLRPGGVLTVRTDVCSYADWVRRNALGIQSLRERSDREPAPVAIETLYEQRRRAAGETIHTMIWCRVRSPSWDGDETPSAGGEEQE